MQIPQSEFNELLLPPQVPYSTLYPATVTRFCRPMTVRGLCTTHCDNCKPKLQAIMNSTAAEDPRIPYAFLTGCFKRAIADFQDAKEQPAPVPSTNALGEVLEETNPFLEFLEIT